jgi:uncharacterized protein YndB with AHSA1/START domain
MILSAALQNYMMSTGSFKGGMDGSYLKIYSGTAPASPNDAVPGGSTLLCVVSVDGTATGVTFEATATPGLLVKAAAEPWEGTNEADGTATWFRLAPTADVGDASTTALRLQGSVGQAGADLNITSTSLTSGAVQSVDYFSILKPA